MDKETQCLVGIFIGIALFIGSMFADPFGGTGIWLMSLGVFFGAYSLLYIILDLANFRDAPPKREVKTVVKEVHHHHTPTRVTEIREIRSRSSNGTEVMFRYGRRLE